MNVATHAVLGYTPAKRDSGEDHEQIVGFRAADSLIEALDKEAAASFRSRSFVIRRILSEALGVPFHQCSSVQVIGQEKSLREVTHGN